MNRTSKIGLWAGVFILAMGAVCSSPMASADDVYTFVIRKEEEKAKSRWSLADWLVTRDKMRLQDLWLAAHTSQYEYFIGANYQIAQDVASQSYSRNWEVFAGAYSTLVGLEFHYERADTSRMHWILDFRFFGRHDQGTNLTAQVGLVSVNPPGDTYRSAFLGGSMTFYIARYFGLEFLYRHYFPSTYNQQGMSFYGDRYVGGGFIDFKFVRIYADYFADAGSGPPYTGLALGTKIYF
ncbi:MAG: hypothetical protein HYX41_06085 [Bdellovibrio sp.]|nr:hypothetical protein [Bdellovibrio sp.]